MLFVHDLRKLLLQDEEGIGIVSNSRANGHESKAIEYKRIDDEIYLAMRNPRLVMIDLLKAIGFQEIRNSEKAIWMKIHCEELEQVSLPVIRERCAELGYDIT